MIKTIKIDDNTELTLSNNIGWAMEYREQFGHDIVPDLLPVVSAVISLFDEIPQDKKGKIDLKRVNKDVLQDALINLAGLQFVDFINLIWALAKNADDKIPEPKKWVKQFETFPLDIIAPEVFKLITEGFVSSKNLPRLSLAEATKQK